MKYKKHILLFVATIFILAACQSKEANEIPISSFTFTDQEGQPFGTDELSGKIWIANFIFTNCTTVCEPMTIEMAILQDLFEKEDIELEFISFTVDPKVDTPDKLKSYIKNFTNDLSNWHVLTGYPQDKIESFAREEFRSIVQKPASSNQVLHGTNFYLINQEGVLVGEYNYIEDTFKEDLLQEIKKLL